MAIETAKDSLCVNQVISQKTNNFIIEDDVIVPDIKPDAHGKKCHREGTLPPRRRICRPDRTAYPFPGLWMTGFAVPHTFAGSCSFFEDYTLSGS